MDAEWSEEHMRSGGGGVDALVLSTKWQESMREVGKVNCEANVGWKGHEPYQLPYQTARHPDTLCCSPVESVKGDTMFFL